MRTMDRFLLVVVLGMAPALGVTAVEPERAPVQPAVPRLGISAPASRSEGSGAAPASGPTSLKPFTTINSDLLNFDYEKRIAIFEGNVVAVDPQLSLKCHKMIVFFAEKQSEVIRVESTGDVRMLHEGKEAFGEKAVFTRETGTIVLSEGHPKLRDEKGNWIVSRGEGIIYNVNTKLMKVDKPAMEVQSSSGGDLLSPSTPK